MKFIVLTAVFLCLFQDLTQVLCLASTVANQGMHRDRNLLAPAGAGTTVSTPPFLVRGAGYGYSAAFEPAGNPSFAFPGLTCSPKTCQNTLLDISQAHLRTPPTTLQDGINQSRLLARNETAAQVVQSTTNLLRFVSTSCAGDDTIRGVRNSLLGQPVLAAIAHGAGNVDSATQAVFVAAMLPGIRDLASTLLKDPTLTEFFMLMLAGGNTDAITTYGPGPTPQCPPKLYVTQPQFSANMTSVQIGRQAAGHRALHVFAEKCSDTGTKNAVCSSTTLDIHHPNVTTPVGALHKALGNAARTSQAPTQMLRNYVQVLRLFQSADCQEFLLAQALRDALNAEKVLQVLKTNSNNFAPSTATLFEDVLRSVTHDPPFSTCLDG